jgi:hypothetical protein
MLVLLWIVNLVISILNAWGVGKTWAETKAVGGPSHFMSWMGAVMAAVGFTWCYMVPLGFVAATVPFTDEASGVSAPLLSMDQLSVFFDLAYLVLIFPLVGSGMAIMTHSWRVFAHDRSLRNGATAGWNTFAQIHNFYSAIEHVPLAMDNVGDFFSGSSDDDGKGRLILILVTVAVLGGILTTYLIISRTARSTVRERLWKYESLREDERRASA